MSIFRNQPVGLKDAIHAILCWAMRLVDPGLEQTN